MTNSRAVTSNQDGLHPRLEEIVRRHRTHENQAPVVDHARSGFESLSQIVERAGRPLILDSGCGTGDSTRNLARAHPGHFVVGIDKSLNRLSKRRVEPNPENLFLMRGDLMDLYPLIAGAGWDVDQHYILYPNPWPKAAHLQRRWHGSAIFPSLLSVGRTLHLRSNWRIYVEEFATALKVSGVFAEISPLKVTTSLSPFEAKYAASGHDLWQLRAELES